MLLSVQWKGKVLGSEDHDYIDYHVATQAVHPHQKLSPNLHNEKPHFQLQNYHDDQSIVHYLFWNYDSGYRSWDPRAVAPRVVLLGLPDVFSTTVDNRERVQADVV